MNDILWPDDPDDFVLIEIKNEKKLHFFYFFIPV